MLNESNQRIVLIGYGGVTPKLREMMLVAAWIKKDIFILPEGDITQDTLDKLNSEYDVNVNILPEGLLVDNVKNYVVSLDSMYSTFLSSKEIISTELESTIFSTTVDLKSISNSYMSKKNKNERPYPKVPPRKLKK